jgi:hypothetical protein
MAVQAKDALLVDAHSFPNGIATLYGAIKNGHFGLVTWHQAIAYPNKDFSISGIVGL